MKKLFKISLRFFLPFLLNLNFVFPANLPDDITFWSDFPHEILADALVEKMSDEEFDLWRAR